MEASPIQQLSLPVTEPAGGAAPRGNPVVAAAARPPVPSPRPPGTRCNPLPGRYRLRLPSILPNGIPVRRIGCASCFRGFKRQQLLGTGTYAEVWSVQQENTGKMYAAKILQPHRFAADTAPRVCEMFEKEIFNLSMCQCPGVVSLHEVIEGGEGWMLLLDLVEGGTVWAADLTTTEGESFCLFVQLLQALLHIQACKVIHRDLKPTNMLLSRKTKRLYIADFGWSESADSCHVHAPEWPG